MFLNWNNKPAPEWGAASDEWSEGPIHRVQLYTGFTTGMTEAEGRDDHEQGARRRTFAR